MLLSSSTYQLGLHVICITNIWKKAYFGKNITFLLVMKIRPKCIYLDQFVFNEWLSLTSFSEDNFHNIKSLIQKFKNSKRKRKKEYKHILLIILKKKIIVIFHIKKCLIR